MQTRRRKQRKQRAQTQAQAPLPPAKNPYEFQARLEAAVTEAGGIDKLAKRLGVPCSTVWRWLEGKTAPSLLAMRLLRASGIV